MIKNQIPHYLNQTLPMTSACTSDADLNLSNLFATGGKKKAETVAGGENKAIGGKSIIPAPVLSDAPVPAL